MKQLLMVGVQQLRQLKEKEKMNIKVQVLMLSKLLVFILIIGCDSVEPNYLESNREESDSLTIIKLSDSLSVYLDNKGDTVFYFYENEVTDITW
jgi:hypothetical protein